MDFSFKKYKKLFLKLQISCLHRGVGTGEAMKPGLHRNLELWGHTQTMWTGPLCNENENFVHSIAAAWWIDGTAYSSSPNSHVMANKHVYLPNFKK